MTSLSTSQPRARRREASEFRVLYGVAYVLFLTLALLARLSPRSWLGRRDQGKSILAEARDMTSASVPFAFMG